MMVSLVLSQVIAEVGTADLAAFDELDGAVRVVDQTVDTGAGSSLLRGFFFLLILRLGSDPVVHTSDLVALREVVMVAVGSDFVAGKRMNSLFSGLKISFSCLLSLFLLTFAGSDLGLSVGSLLESGLHLLFLVLLGGKRVMMLLVGLMMASGASVHGLVRDGRSMLLVMLMQGLHRMVMSVSNANPVVDAVDNTAISELSRAVLVVDQAGEGVLVFLIVSGLSLRLVSRLLLLGVSLGLGELLLLGLLIFERLISLSRLLSLLVTFSLSVCNIADTDPVVDATNDSALFELSHAIRTVVETRERIDMSGCLLGGNFLLLFLLLFSSLEVCGIFLSLGDLFLTRLLLLKSLIIIANGGLVLMVRVGLHLNDSDSRRSGFLVDGLGCITKYFFECFWFKSWLGGLLLALLLFGLSIFPFLLFQFLLLALDVMAGLTDFLGHELGVEVRVFRFSSWLNGHNCSKLRLIILLFRMLKNFADVLFAVRHNARTLLNERVRARSVVIRVEFVKRVGE